MHCEIKYEKTKNIIIDLRSDTT